MASKRSQITMTDDEVHAYLNPSACSTSPRSARPGIRIWWRCGIAMVAGNPVFWTFGKSQKILNLRRDPKMTGLVESGDTTTSCAVSSCVGRG